MKKISKVIIALVLFAMLFSITGCTSAETVKIGGMADLEGKNIGVQTGTTGDTLASDAALKAKNVERYPQYVDVISAVKQKKVDCAVMDVDTATVYLKANSDLTMLDVGFEPEQYAVAVQKGNSDLLTAINAVIAEMKADGSLAASLEAHADQAGSAPDYNVNGKNGNLVVGTEAGFPPYEYTSGDNIIGTDIDIMARVAKKLDMKLVVENMAFDGLITAVSTGKVDAAAAGMTINDERKVNVDFSEPYVDATNIVVIRKTSVK
ncbi:MAG TPA: amino acid ABC transporter substrate-binding protein [Clostridiales bacterium]|nr:amino acid ABC transporter substrate-binding protein [Clostridiales bacterium]